MTTALQDRWKVQTDGPLPYWAHEPGHLLSICHTPRTLTSRERFPVPRIPRIATCSPTHLTQSARLGPSRQPATLRDLAAPLHGSST